MKRNKGITLIALVITIIVLLILAGVAISMLSGENGILRKAAEAKTKTEEAQKEESTTLLDMEIDSYFITNNLKYKCRYGYITGIKVGEKAKELKDVLSSQGYTLRNIENTADVADDTKLTTGMAITKNGEVTARTVIFGDVDCNGEVDSFDGLKIGQFLESKMECQEYQIIAMDVNHDGIINYKNDTATNKINQLDDQIMESEDEEEINKLESQIKSIEKNLYDANIIQYYEVKKEYGKEIIENQKIYASSPKMIKYNTINKEIDNYINSIPNTFYQNGYKIEKFDDDNFYSIKGVVRGTTTVGNIKAVLPNNTIIKCEKTELTNLETIIEENKKYFLYIKSEDFDEIQIGVFE